MFGIKIENLESNKIISLSVMKIQPNPCQPRRNFSDDSLRELALSISQYGILQPLVVRRVDGEYELIAGERRLRAARLAGLESVPCIVSKADTEASAAIALIENLQRQDLDFFEEALGYQALIRTFGLTQEEVARKIGKTQSAVANKLRLLRLDERIIDIIRRSSLTERHARALLRLPDQMRPDALLRIVEYSLNVEATERYIEGLINPVAKTSREEAPQRSRLVLKDVRLFFNTIEKAIDMFNRSCDGVQYGKAETDGAYEITITIPKPEKKKTGGIVPFIAAK